MTRSQCDKNSICTESDCRDCLRIAVDKFRPPITDKTQTDLYKDLVKVEAFMEASGIRKFCSDVCHGYCCSGCTRPKGKTRCYEGGPRNINCSLYLCHSLQSLLGAVIPEDKRALLRVTTGGEYYTIHGERDYNLYRSRLPKNLGDAKMIRDILEPLPFKDMKTFADFSNKVDKTFEHKKNIEHYKSRIAEILKSTGKKKISTIEDFLASKKISRKALESGLASLCKIESLNNNIEMSKKRVEESFEEYPWIKEHVEIE